MTDGLNQFRAGFGANMFAHGFALVAVFGIDTDFNQFVVVEGDVDFIQYRCADTGLAGDDNGFEAMRFGAELLF